MIPRSLDFHIQKSIRAYEIFIPVQNFYISLDLSLRYTIRAEIFFYISKGVNVYEWGVFLYKFFGRPTKYIRMETFFFFTFFRKRKAYHIHSVICIYFDEIRHSKGNTNTDEYTCTLNSIDKTKPTHCCTVQFTSVVFATQ